MHVLIFSWFFPPYLSAGASRVGQLSKYLDRAGVRVSVVTGRPRDLPALADIQTGVEVHYAPHIELNVLPQRLLGRASVTREGYRLSRLGHLRILGRVYRQMVHFPDAQIGWVPSAVRSAGRVDRPDVVFSSSPPASAHIAAAAYARRVGLPWIAEYRDPWTNNPAFRRWWPTRRLEELLERAVTRRATALTAVTPGLASVIGSLLGRRTGHIPNGYDPDDHLSVATPERGILFHAGTVYTTYATRAFLDGVVKAERPVVMRFAGRNLADLPEQIQAAGASHRVELLGPVRHGEVIDLMRHAEANILFQWSRSQPLADIYVPQKLYEYLAARRPIFVIGHDSGDAAAILRSSGLATFLKTAEDVKRAIDDGTPGVAADEQVIARYAYGSIADQFVGLFRQVLNGEA